MVSIKKIYGLLTILLFAVFTRFFPVYASPGELVIRHVAKVPDGRQYVLGVESIPNITDIYYYTASQSPVASKFLKSGFSLTDEKNRLIEADVVSNGGKIDLEYTPELQKVSVTYFRKDGETEEEMGTITDNAYVGEEYRPQLPVYDGADVLAALIGGEDYFVKYGENNFKVTYALTNTERLLESGSSSSGSGRSSTSAGSAGNVSESESAYSEILADLYMRGIIPEIRNGYITWEERFDDVNAYYDSIQP